MQILSRSLRNTELKDVFCYLRNKQMKFFKDAKMMELEGIIDFDLVQTVVSLDDDYVCIDEEEKSRRQICRQDDNETVVRSKSAMPTKRRTGGG